MKGFLGSNIVEVKAHNRQAVLQCLLSAALGTDEQPLSRIQLAQMTNLSSTTITNLVAELIEQDLVIEDKNPREDFQRSVGRPRTGLCLIPEARYVIGVHIGVGIYRVGLMNLLAQVVCSKIVNFDINTPAQDILRGMSNDIHALITGCGVDRQLIMGVGVGASGLVDIKKGINILAPNLGWHYIPIRDYLEDQLGLPVIVENNVRAMALGEAYFGCGREAQSLAFVYGRTGVGAGFVVNRRLFRGSFTGAGEIGHMILVPENGDLCRCGNRGCLETLVSEAMIIRKALKIAASQPTGIMAHTMAESGDDTQIEQIFKAARQGDTAILQVIQEVGHYLSVALANMVNVFSPELIILGGLFAQGEDLILPVARDTLNHLAFAGLGEKVRLVTTSFGWRAGVTGAAALALLAFFYQQPSITQLPVTTESVNIPYF